MTITLPLTPEQQTRALYAQMLMRMGRHSRYLDVANSPLKEATHAPR